MRGGPEDPKKLKCYRFRKGTTRRLRCVGERPPGLGDADPRKTRIAYVTIEALVKVIRLPANISVTDDKTRQDITEEILLKIVEHLEGSTAPVMSDEFLSGLIRCVEPRPVLRAFLERTLSSFANNE